MATLFDQPATPRIEPAPPPADALTALRLAPANPEVVIADATLDRLADARASLCTWLRRECQRIYLQRLDKQGFTLACVTADDARFILDNTPGVPGPEQLNRNFMGTLFRKSDGWRCTGQFIKSRTPGSRGNLIRCWRWEGAH